MPQSDNNLYTFGEFRLDPFEHALFHRNELVPLTPKALETLIALVRRAGHVVSKEDLIQEVWPDTFVEEGNLNVNISALRKALAERGKDQGFIETIPRRGYRFVAPIEVASADPVELVIQHRKTTRIVQEEEAVDPTPLLPQASLNSSANSVTSPATLTQQATIQLDARQSPTSFVRRKRLAVVVSLVALVALAAYLSRDFIRSRMGGEQRRMMLGVLPLVDLSGNPDQEYLSDGLTEEIISQLGSLNPSRLGVIARTSVMTYKHTNKGVNQIGRELGVDYVVEGSVRRSGNRIRVTAQLIRAADQSHLWAESYDRDLGDILNVEEDVSRSIAKAIRIQLKPPEPTRSGAHPANSQAYEHYLRGRYLMEHRHGAAINGAIESYSQAVTEDPNYALAYAALADAYLVKGLFSVRTIDVMPQAESAAAKAVELDASSAEAHTALAGVKALYDWDWRGAEQEFKRALDLNPDDARAHHAYATFFCAPLGRQQETIEHMERALKLDPLSPIIVTDLGWAYYLEGQTDRAMDQYQKARNLDAFFVSALDRIAQVYEQKGMYEQMLALNEANAQFNAEIAAAMRRGYQQGGYQGALRAEIGTMEERVRRPGMVYDPYSFAYVYAKLGEYDRALENLETAYEERNPGMVYMKVDPPFRGLRENPQFQNLERRVGLVP